MLGHKLVGKILAAPSVAEISALFVKQVVKKVQGIQSEWSCFQATTLIRLLRSSFGSMNQNIDSMRNSLIECRLLINSNPVEDQSFDVFIVFTDVGIFRSEY